MSGLAGKLAAVTAGTTAVASDRVPNFQHYNYVSVQVATGAGAGGAAQVVVTPEVSNDGVSWVAISADALTVAVSSVGVKNLGSYPFAYLRFSCDADAGTIVSAISWCCKE